MRKTTRKQQRRAVAAAAATRRASRPPAVTSLKDLPLVLRVDEVMALYRCGRTHILEGVRAGTFQPPPFVDKPYRWLKEDIERDLAQRRAAAQQRVQRALESAARDQRRRVRA